MLGPASLGLHSSGTAMSEKRETPESMRDPMLGYLHIGAVSRKSRQVAIASFVLGVVVRPSSSLRRGSEGEWRGSSESSAERVSEGTDDSL